MASLITDRPPTLVSNRLARRENNFPKGASANMQGTHYRVVTEAFRGNRIAFWQVDGPISNGTGQYRASRRTSDFGRVERMAPSAVCAGLGD